MGLLLGLLGVGIPGCWWRTSAPSDGVDVPDMAREVLRLPAGEVLEGRFRSPGFSIDVPEGWVAEPGWQGAPRRLTLRHSVSEASLEIWRWPEGEIRRRERGGCAWRFSDEGRYTNALRVPGPIEVATCSPEGSGPRILGWYIVNGGAAWHLEMIVPQGALAEALPEVEALLATVRFD